MCRPNEEAMTVPPKGETVVHPAGQDWPRADPFAFLIGPQIRDVPSSELPYDGVPLPERLSAPPRASWGDKVGLVLGALWNRLCGRSRWLSCAVLVAAAVVAGIGVAMEQLSHLIGA